MCCPKHLDEMWPSPTREDRAKLTELSQQQADYNSPCRWEAPYKPEALPVLMGLAGTGPETARKLIGAAVEAHPWGGFYGRDFSRSCFSRISSRPLHSLIMPLGLYNRAPRPAGLVADDGVSAGCSATGCSGPWPMVKASPAGSMRKRIGALARSHGR